MAQAAHAANKLSDIMKNSQQYKTWASPNGFGTTIILGITGPELLKILSISKQLDIISDEVIDETYPYTLHSEYANLIHHPTDFPPIPCGNGMMKCIREELTCGFVFGTKETLMPIIGHLKLHN